MDSVHNVTDREESPTDTAGVIAPPPLIYLGTLGIGFGLDAVIGTGSVPSAVAAPVGTALIIAGAGLLGSFVEVFERARTPIDPYTPSQTIVTDGPYGLTRNPAYLGMALTYAGIAIVANAPWASSRCRPRPRSLTAASSPARSATCSRSLARRTRTTSAVSGAGSKGSGGAVLGSTLGAIRSSDWPRMRQDHDIVVIGGGQAGLAMSAVLQEHGREHVVLERRRVGERWRTERWESMRFQFPNWALELPGYSYSGEDPDGFAHWREVLRVIEQYAASTHAPVREHTEVTALRPAEGGFVLAVPDGPIHARRVVVATGPFQRPRIHSCPRTLRRRSCRPIRRGTRARRTCLTVPCSWSVAGRPVARSVRNCCVPGAPCSSRSPGIGASRGGFAGRMSPGGWSGWVASTRRLTASPGGSGPHRSSSPA